MIPTDDDLNRAAAVACGHDMKTRDAHEWERDEDGEIDRMAFSGSHCNGPQCARCGFYYCEYCNCYRGEPPFTGCTPKPPRFCQDRNALPELLTTVKTAWRSYQFGQILTGGGEYDVAAAVALDILQKSGREIVIAALKALGRWEAGWDEGQTVKGESL